MCCWVNFVSEENAASEDRYDPDYLITKNSTFSSLFIKFECWLHKEGHRLSSSIEMFPWI